MGKRPASEVIDPEDSLRPRELGVEVITTPAKNKFNSHSSVYLNDHMITRIHFNCDVFPDI